MHRERQGTGAGADTQKRTHLRTRRHRPPDLQAGQGTRCAHVAPHTHAHHTTPHHTTPHTVRTGVLSKRVHFKCPSRSARPQDHRVPSKNTPPCPLLARRDLPTMVQPESRTRHRINVPDTWERSLKLQSDFSLVLERNVRRQGGARSICLNAGRSVLLG